MTTYFDYRRIDELLEDNCNCYRQQKEFTLDELSQYDGKNGKPAYVAIEGIIYDASNELVFREAKNIEIIAGKDLTEQFNSYCIMSQIINEAPKIGVLDDNNDIECEINIVGYEQAKQNTSKFSHDYWSNYIEPLVKYARSDRNKHGTKKSCKCQECIMSDALLGAEKILQEYIKQVLEWQTQLLKCSGPTTVGVGTTESAGATSNGVGGPGGGIGIAAGVAGGSRRRIRCSNQKRRSLRWR
jgi:predicted heme/steroid binding protein